MECRNCLKYNGKACELGLYFPCGEYVPHIITPLERAGDLISRSALLKHIDECINGDCVAEWKPVLYAVRCQVVVAPAVDAVQVVRCKDCKNWDCYGGEASRKGDCSELVGLESCMYEDDFCSYGERKGNGT